MGPPKFSETNRGRMLKLKTQLDILKYSLYVKNFSARWRPGGVGPPSVNLGPPNISESTRARKLKLKSQLDMLNYSRTQYTCIFSATGRLGVQNPLSEL